MIDPVAVGVVDEELSEEAVKDEEDGDVQGEVGNVAEAVLYPDPVPLSPEEILSMLHAILSYKFHRES